MNEIRNEFFYRECENINFYGKMKTKIENS